MVHETVNQWAHPGPSDTVHMGRDRCVRARCEHHSPRAPGFVLSRHPTSLRALTIQFWRFPAQLALGGALVAGFSIAAARQFELNPSPINVAITYRMPTLFDVEVALRRVGISPESLTAAGVSAESIAGIVSRVDTLLTNDPGFIASPQGEHGYARTECDRLTRLIQSGQATQQDLIDCQTAATNAATHLAALNAALDDVFEEATSGLTQAQINTLSTIRTNAQSRRMPTEFLVITLDQSDWIRLR